jgi:hypothetical protein
MRQDRAAKPGEIQCASELLQAEPLVLSERERAVFFDTLVHPPEVSARLRRVFAAARLRVAVPCFTTQDTRTPPRLRQ